MTDTNVQKIHIPFNTDLDGRSWIDRDGEYLQAIPNVTKEEWSDFFDRVDYSLNQDAKPQFEKAISEENQEESYESSFSDCICRVFMRLVGGGSDPSRGGGSGKRADPNIKACMKVLCKENERREYVFFQLVISRGGRYVLFVECTIMIDEEDKVNVKA